MNNKIDLVLVAGLPGSGKTYWCKQFLSKHPEYQFFDDVSLEPFLTNKVIGQINSGNSKLLISDSNLISTQFREVMVNILFNNPAYEVGEIDLYCFENDISKCMKKLIQKGEGRKIDGLLYNLSSIYDKNMHCSGNKLPTSIPICIRKYVDGVLNLFYKNMKIHLLPIYETN